MFMHVFGNYIFPMYNLSYHSDHLFSVSTEVDIGIKGQSSQAFPLFHLSHNHNLKIYTFWWIFEKLHSLSLLSKQVYNT